APAGDEAAEEVDRRDGEGELGDEVAQVRVVEGELVAEDGLQQVELRPGHAGQLLIRPRVAGVGKRLRVELAPGDLVEQLRYRLVDGGTAALGGGGDLPVGRQVAHDVQVGPQVLAVAGAVDGRRKT